MCVRGSASCPTPFTVLTYLSDPAEVRVRLITSIPKRPLHVETRILLDSGQCGKHSRRVHTTRCGLLPISSGIHLLRYPTDYETDEKTFLDIVERDAAEFRPLGNKIHSYQRVSSSGQGKGKGVASAGDLDPEREDVIEYEVYHVSTRFVQATCLAPHINNPRSRHGIPRVSGSTTEECKYSSSSTSRAVRTSWRMNQLGSSWYCKPLSPLPPLGPPSPLL